ncbi:unnamed protein product [Bursaphelenchus xylophilus]|uniref:(pine wood nematode) hypothetical protein n=1 Tax=Bursaphelenchus xylophilus TaxID=6326 RepID=A0A1I7RIT3_BURXY|nr:unnamed protein product [Bursaphelenchus xylophilus]CAG9119076.1 unnamed protein product [Bursaphelenchus xylophilus]
MNMLFASLLLICGLSSGLAKSFGKLNCSDHVHNLVVANSDFSHQKPSYITFLTADIYNHDHSPSCAFGRPNVPLPGFVKFLDGELHVTKYYDVLKDGVLKATVRSSFFEKPICLNGESQYLALPNSMCQFKISDFMNHDIVRVLEEPGVHTLQEITERIGLNSTIELPEPPSFLGISLLDLLSGEFAFGFQIETNGQTVMDVMIPTNHKWLQIGVADNSVKDEDESGSEEE